MMNIQFTELKRNISLSHDESIQVEYPLSLPGVSCRACKNVWVYEGRSSFVPKAGDYSFLRKKHPVNAETISKTIARVRKVSASSDDACSLLPGMRFGRAKVVEVAPNNASGVYWWAGSMFVRAEIAGNILELQRYGVSFIPCLEPFEDIVEIVPLMMSRSSVYPVVQCSVCGKRDAFSAKDGSFANALCSLVGKQYVIGVPSSVLFSQQAREVVSRVSIASLTFAEVSLEDLVARAT